MLQRDAGMLLLAAATDAKVWAARRFPFRAIIQATLNLRAGKLFFIFGNDDVALSPQ